MSYRVVFSAAAADDLERLYDFTLQRELDSATGDLDIPARALQAVRDAIATLTEMPFTCRKSGTSPFQRELVIPFGNSGCVALFEIVSADALVIGAVRHQREDDYH